MTVAAAAAELCMSKRVVYELCRTGRLGHYRYGPSGGKIDIDPRHLAEYRASCEVLPGERGVAWEPARRVVVPDVLGELRRSKRHA